MELGEILTMHVIQEFGKDLEASGRREFNRFRDEAKKSRIPRGFADVVHQALADLDPGTSADERWAKTSLAVLETDFQGDFGMCTYALVWGMAISAMKKWELAAEAKTRIGTKLNENRRVLAESRRELRDLFNGDDEKVAVGLRLFDHWDMARKMEEVAEDIRLTETTDMVFLNRTVGACKGMADNYCGMIVMSEEIAAEAEKKEKAGATQKLVDARTYVERYFKSPSKRIRIAVG